MKAKPILMKVILLGLLSSPTAWSRSDLVDFLGLTLCQVSPQMYLTLNDTTGTLNFFRAGGGWAGWTLDRNEVTVSESAKLLRRSIRDRSGKLLATSDISRQEGAGGKLSVTLTENTAFPGKYSCFFLSKDIMKREEEYSRQ